MVRRERTGGESGRPDSIVPVEGDRAYAAGRFRFFLREALRRLWVSRRTSFVAILMITISLVILGSFLLLSENLNQAMDQWQGRSKLTIWMDLDATPEAVRAVDSSTPTPTTGVPSRREPRGTCSSTLPSPP